jgi:Flp pilus assembly protein TadG
MVTPRRHPPGPRAVRAALGAEDGNALVEFVVLSAALLIPCLYLVLTLGNIQAAVFAADTISRDVARIHATAQDPEVAAQRAARHTEMILEDHGLSPGDVVTLRCSEDPCATPGGSVTAQARVPVPVPGLGPVLGQTGPVTVGASHTVPVDQYRAGR